MKALYLITTCVLVSFSATAKARSIFLNGTDISSSRGQQMKGVNVFIDDEGNVIIDAPQYRVHEESTYTPLSRYSQSKSTAVLRHKSPQRIGKDEKPDSPESPKSAELVPMSNDVGGSSDTAKNEAPKTDPSSVKKSSAVQGAEVKLIEKAGQKLDATEPATTP